MKGNPVSKECKFTSPFTLNTFAKVGFGKQLTMILEIKIGRLWPTDW